MIDLAAQEFSFLSEAGPRLTTLVLYGSRARGATQLFAKLMKYREEADYNPTFDFAAEDLPVLRREVEQVAARIRALVAAAQET